MKNVEDEDAGEISEAESPLLLSRDPKDWKVTNRSLNALQSQDDPKYFTLEPRSLRCSRSL